MIYQKIMLSEIDLRFNSSDTFIRAYIADPNQSVSTRPGLIILPGGGYEYCSEGEAEPIACRFLAEGFNCFVVNYSCYTKYPQPHLEVALVFSYIRKNLKRFRIRDNFISLVGFSAGGHLAASYSYLYKELAPFLREKETNLKPNAIMLAYPVLSMKEETHEVTKEIISNNEQSLIDKLHVLDHIKKDYPPTFIWTTLEDMAVPVSNTSKMIKALETAKVRHEYKYYEHGFHGSSIYTRGCTTKENYFANMEQIKDWPRLAANFVFKIIDKE